MASYNVRLFKNTGFNADNIPDNASLLNDDNISKVDVDAVWLYQNQNVGKIRIKTNFTDIYSVDYCRIGSVGNNQTFTYYFVSNIVMVNPVTAELDLQIDAITTIGLSNIANNILSGWCRRRCVTDDTLFSNCIDEDFIPTEPIKSDTYFIDVPKDGRLVAVSTIDLDKIDYVCELYKSSLESTSVDVAVPSVPVINSDYTKVRIMYKNLYVERELVGKRMYDLTRGDDYIVKYQKAIRTVWSLGLQDAIVGIYYLPVGSLDSGFLNNINYFNGRYGTSADDNTAISLQFITGAKIDTIDFKWNTTAKNNKVFSTRFNKLKLMSVSSGNSADYLASEIYNNTDKAEFVVTLDPSENGTTRCKPKYIRGVDLDTTTNQFELFRDTVTGSNWVSANINMQLPKGIAKTLNSLNIDETAGTLGSAGSGLKSLFGLGLPNLEKNGNLYESFTMPYYPSTSLVSQEQVYSGALDQVSPITKYNYIGNPKITFGQNSGFISTTFNSLINKQRRNLSRANLYMQTPETWFPIDDNISNYIGNSYYVVRERLSDKDTQKFDRFLTMYGYAVNEPLTKDCFYGRQYFNYIECEDLTLGKLNVGSQQGNIQECPLRLKQIAIDMLQGGVRIWHTIVNINAFNNNPIVGETNVV